MTLIDQFKKGSPKMRLLMAGMLVCVVMLVARLWQVQIYSYKRHWRHLRQQSFRTVRVPASRGKILDRNGLALAENKPGFNINLYLQEIRPQFQAEYARTMDILEQDPEFNDTHNVRAVVGSHTRYMAASKLAAELGEVMNKRIVIDKEKFTHHFQQRLSLPLSIMKDVSEAEAARFLEKSNVPPGFYLDVQPLRSYPYGETAAHLVGYLRRYSVDHDEGEMQTRYQLPDYEGVMGLEKTFDQELRGKAGVKSILVNTLGYQQSETMVAPPIPGENVVLTLDLRVQLAAERALQSAASELGQEVRGSAVVLDPNNGDILAMASAPSFDPNLFIPGISTEDWKSIETPEDPTRKALRDRACQEIYQPGSIFKIIVGLAMLEKGVCDPDEIFQTRGRYYIGNYSWNDTAPPGRYNFRRAFMRSSNYYFIHFGLEAGMDAIIDMGKRFHLGEPFDLPVSTHPGRFPDHEYLAQTREKRGRAWSDGDTANVCIGQGELDVTLLQMAVMAAAIANKGKVYWPRLVQRLETPQNDGPAISTQVFPPRLRSRLGVDPENLKIIREGMLADVEDPEGTGKAARVPGMVIGGKTGTAETEGVRKNTWFVSMSPVENARYVVVVMVENGVSGGRTCAPIARRIYETLHELERHPDSEVSPPKQPTPANAS